MTPVDPVTKNSPFHDNFLLALWCGAVFLLFGIPLLDFGPVGSSSEAREVHVANLMQATADYILPLRHGLVPSKPPLFHWLCVALASARGEVVTAANCRLVSLLAAAGIIVIVGYLAALRAPPDRQRLRLLLTVMVLGTTYGFVNMAEVAMVDMAFALMVTLSLCSLLIVRPDALESKHWSGFFFFAGLAVLAKGPLGIVLPGLVAYFVLSSEFGLTNSLKIITKPRLGWLMFLLVACPWYLLAAEKGQDGFLERQLLFENIARLLGGAEVNSEDPWFYLGSILRTAAPWTWLFVIILTAELIRGAKPRAGLRLDSVGAWWFGAGIALLSLASGKRHSYELPLFPGLALFLGEWLEAKAFQLSDFDRHRLFKFLRNLAAVLCLLIIGFLAIIFSIQSWTGDLPPALILVRRMILNQGQRPTLVLFAALLGGGVFYFTRRNQMIFGLARAWVLLTALLLVGTHTGLGLKNYLKGFDRMAEDINSVLPMGHSLYVVREKNEEYYDPVLLYLGRPVTLIEPGTAWPSDGPSIVRRDKFKELQIMAARKNLILIEHFAFKQRLDWVNGESDRDLVLYSIRPAAGAPNAGPESSDAPAAELNS